MICLIGYEMATLNQGNVKTSVPSTIPSINKRITVFGFDLISILVHTY